MSHPHRVFLILKMMKETYIQLHDIAPNHPNIIGLPFNIVDNTDLLIAYLHEYINVHFHSVSDCIGILPMLGHRGVSVTTNHKQITEMIGGDPNNVKTQHMLSRVIEDIVAGDYQILISVINNRIDDMTRAYRVPPLRLFVGKDKKSWVKIEQLVEPLVGAEINQELFDKANMSIAVKRPQPPERPVSFQLSIPA